MTLRTYKKKRSFKKTPEPLGKPSGSRSKKTFVVQRHDASHLHYDFRLEAKGVLKSWAIPKGPSMNPSEKRLAVMVEDHPIEYAKFEGDIPEGNYGAGHVDIWDNGSYEPVDENGETMSEKEFLAHLKNGSVKFKLNGKKLKGEFALVLMKGGGENNWLLIKHKDEFATNDDYDIESLPHSLKAAKKSNSKKGNAKKSPYKASYGRGKETVKFTNIDKVFFPDDGYTKGDIIEYYDKISKYILKHLKDRPQSLRRNPNGIKDDGFFHKDVGGDVPDWIDKYKSWSDSANKEINYIVCNKKATLLYMANMGCIEINPWNSRTISPDNPDYLVLDLDPSDKNTFDEVIETAQVIHEILEGAGCANYCKTSGATGLHIYVPLAAKYDYEQARIFSQIVAKMAQEQLPKITSVERSLKKRGNKIYIDYLQNKTGQTLSCVYSARPKPGATVSTPLEWKEVKPGLTPQDFNIMNIFKRLEKKGDLFAQVLKKGIDMEKVLRKLEG